MVERVATGIPGLDDLIEGGLPRNSATLVSGSAGTGKTIFCCQYLWHGLQNGENAVYITMEEDADKVLDNAREMGWDLEQYADEGRFRIDYLNPFSMSGGFEDRIRERIENVDADRVVIDSTSVMGMHTDSPSEVRKQIYDLMKHLRELEVTAVLTAEVPKGRDGVSRYGVEEFVADGVILLHYMGIGAGIYRNIEVPKIRNTNQRKGSFPMQISDRGITVFESEEEYAEHQED